MNLILNLLAAALPIVFTSAAFAGVCGNSPEYACNVLPRGGKDVGRITLCGNPVSNEYTAILVRGEPQAVRPGATSPVYQYLFDRRTGAPTLAIETVNPFDSYDWFEMSVYGADHIVLGSRRIARYRCERATN
ncbi:MAG TPA: hypothetical protein VFV50_14670 [Bdellovibrionales bacterium]|nr:hypothetical protein [Bdellovibrionales bacterium]